MMLNLKFAVAFIHQKFYQKPPIAPPQLVQGSPKSQVLFKWHFNAVQDLHVCNH